MTSSAITLRVGCCSLGDEKYAKSSHANARPTNANHTTMEPRDEGMALGVPVAR